MANTKKEDTEPSAINPGRIVVVIPVPVIPAATLAPAVKVGNDPGRDPFIR